MAADRLGLGLAFSSIDEHGFGARIRAGPSRP